MPKELHDLTDLRKLVQLHDVVYDVRTHEDAVVRSLHEAAVVKTGFDLSLCGTHDHGHSTMTPGCEHCVDTYGDLRKIAQWITPAEGRPSSYEIRPFDGGLHGVPSPRGRLEVELRIQIGHRRGWDQPIDDCERLCLKEMEAKLKELGVRRR